MTGQDRSADRQALIARHPPSPAMWYNLGYPKGPHAFFRYMEQWRDAGTFDGLEFR